MQETLRSRPPKRRLKLAAVGLACALVVLALVCWLFPQELLCIEGGDEARGDAIVVLGGGSVERPKRAAELFQAQAAPRIIVSGVGDCEANRRELIRAGVPPDAITLESKSTNTKENAQFTIPLLRAAGAKRAIIVTSWYHSRRALNVFQHYAGDIEFYSRPSYYGYGRSEPSWKSVKSFLRSEYVKILGYWVCYGVWPL